ncbi:DUF1565 domain-containing protein [Archangium violaceum]|nr:DUF1565 domain-containing protein [Archangium violaceum]
MKRFNKSSLFAAALVSSLVTACGAPVGQDGSQEFIDGPATEVPTPIDSPSPSAPPADEVPSDSSQGQTPADQEESASSGPFPLPSTPPAAPPVTTAAYKREWVVSTTGNDTAAGTAAAPLRTISRAISLAGPGELIRVRAGTYAERVLIMGSVRNGTASAPITLLGEGKPRIVLGSQSGALMVVERSHWIIRGFNIDVENRPALGVAFTGNLEGTFLSDSEIHHARYGAGVSFHNGANGATLENNDIHHHVISGQDSHGVMIQPTARNITVRNNVIHDNSGDSIQCYSEDGSMPSAPADGILIEGNDLYGNFEQGLDIKTCFNVTVRRNKMHHSKGNGAMVVHMSAKNILIEENDFYESGLAIGVGGNRYGPLPSGVVIRRNLIRDMSTARGTGGGLQMANSQGTQVYNNTFTRLQAAALIVGSGQGGPTQDMVVKNNIIDAASAVKLGSQAPGLKMDSNLYRPGATFLKGGSSLKLAQWRGQGFDGKSLEGEAQLNATTLAPGPLAVDRGENLGLKFCGAGLDIGAVETGC